MTLIRNTLIAAALSFCLSTASAQTATPPKANQAKLDIAKLQLASVNAAVGGVVEDTPLYMKNADRMVPVASITKLMMAMVILDADQPLDEWLTIVAREHDVLKNAYSRIRIGSRLTRSALLRIALMSSENLAAHVLASHYPGGRNAFVTAMNEKAVALGMTQTRFVDPSGLSPDNRSTAADLLKMVKAAYDYAPIREYSTTRQYTARFRGPRYTLGYGNTNPLVSGSRWDVALSKTGYLTESGRCLVMIANMNGQPIAVVLLDSLGTRTPIGDVGRVRQWLTTGASGAIAGAAREYERRRSAEYEQASAAD
ncbi:MAG: D-alanyl-D-alanine endopeptidase [Aquisalimonadaceae bacterium]